MFGKKLGGTGEEALKGNSLGDLKVRWVRVVI